MLISLLNSISIKIISSGLSGTNDARVVLTLLDLALESERSASPLDGEVIFRALVALGNLLVSSSSGTLALGAIMKAKENAESCALQSSEARITAIMQEVRQQKSEL